MNIRNYFLDINKQNGTETSGHESIWCNCVFKTKQNKSSLVALGNVLVDVSRKPQALRSMRTSTSRPLILVPFMILHALSALSGQSNLTVPQPFDLPFSILISANCTWPAADGNEQITFSSSSFRTATAVRCDTLEQRPSSSVNYKGVKTHHSGWTSPSASAMWGRRTAATQTRSSFNKRNWTESRLPVKSLDTTSEYNKQLCFILITTDIANANSRQWNYVWTDIDSCSEVWTCFSAPHNYTHIAREGVSHQPIKWDVFQWITVQDCSK